MNNHRIFLKYQEESYPRAKKIANKKNGKVK